MWKKKYKKKNAGSKEKSGSIAFTFFIKDKLPPDFIDH